MRSITFCEDTRALFTLAEQMADVLAQKRPELGQDDRTEAHLRASIAGALYSCTVYAAICREKEKSAVARGFLEQADHVPHLPVDHIAAVGEIGIDRPLCF